MNPEQEILSQIRREILQQDPVWRQGVRYREFLSWSNGAGKKRRKKPRQVTLLVVGDIAFQVKNREIIPRKKPNGLPIDVLAQEILCDVPWQDRTPEVLLRRAQKTHKKNKKSVLFAGGFF